MLALRVNSGRKQEKKLNSNHPSERSLHDPYQNLISLPNHRNLKEY